MGEKRLALFREIQNKRLDNEMFVDVTIYDVPASLLREFGEKIIWSSYPSGVSEAIKDLIRKAILEYDLNRNDATVIAA
jgi:metal-responsive CopG/Arc/MetJ family transcriptional regulator